MKRFSGFPGKMQFTPVPNLFFSSLLPEIDDIAELKTTLHLFRVLYARRGYPRFVTFDELSTDRSLLNSLKESGQPERPVLDAMRTALDKAVKRGTILHLALNRDGATEDAYFLNSETDRRAVTKIESGELALAGLKAGGKLPPGGDSGEPPDVFSIYEENVGMLTPMVADELLEAERLYPAGWIRDAIKEAVSLNKRSWRYIERILERWSAEGRNGTHRGDSKTNPEKFIQQRFGHIIRR